MTVAQKPNDSRLIALVELVLAVNEKLNQFYSHWVHHEELEIATKDDESPITEADIAAHHMIEAGLNQLTPSYPILSEESSDFDARHQWQTFWLVDPLDGTREFVKQTGEFTVNIALVEHGEVSLGVIGLPTMNKVYIGQKGGPIYWVEQQDGQSIWHTVAIPEQHPLADSWNIAITRRSDRSDYARFKEMLEQRGQDFNVTNAGSAYKFCLMLEGKIDVYPRLHPTSEWDTAAGQCLLEMIGGALVDSKGRPFAYNQRDELLNGEFLAVRDCRYVPLVLPIMQEVIAQRITESGML